VANVAEPARSRRMVRVPWSRGASEEESRAYLQARLTLLFKLMFWCFVALMAFIWAAYRRYPELEPADNDWVYVCFVIGLAIMAVLWRAGLVRRKLAIDQLYAIDAFYAIGTSTIIATAAVVSHDQRPAVYTCLLYACFAMLTRALIVPSTGTRTAVVTALGSLPLAIGAVILAFIGKWPGKDISGPGFVAGFVQIQLVALALAAAGSHIIYGLRRQVTAAQQLGRYTLVRKIGAGGMGQVYLARHLMLRRPTAVKLLPPDRVRHEDWERFEREVQHLSQLTHPNTVAVFDYGHSPDGLFYYAMEYLGGGINLDQLVRRHGRQPAERVRQILIQICGSLQEAHELQIIHRDIKPANIILCERGAMPDIVKVVDFGLAKETSPERGTTAQVIVGTPGYVAPEALTDPASVGPASDLYAAGCVGYFLLTGRPVFAGKTAIDLCLQHVTKPPPRPSEVAGRELPRALEDLVLHCLAKAPAARPASALALADALAACGPFDDWDEARAVAWWDAHRPREQLADAQAPTETMTIDIVHREAGTPRKAASS
jgi:eukaryotic-like serine/threonine-protein kinase